MSSSIRTFNRVIDKWYLLTILGVIFIAFGIYIFTVPLAAYLSLTIIFSVSFLVGGFFDILFSLQNRNSFSGWGWFLVSGILSLLLGIYLIVYPEVSIATLPTYVGFTFLFRSCQLLGFSLELKNLSSKGWGNLAFISVLGIILSFLLLANPLAAGLSLVTVTALTFLFVGFATLFLSFDIKKVSNLKKEILK